MKKVFRSTFGTLAVAAVLAVAPPMYARGGHGGFRVRGGRGHHFVGPARGSGRYAGRAYYRTRGDRWGDWGSNYGYPYYGYSRYSLGYYGSGYGYPYYGYRSGGYYDLDYGYYPWDIILTATDTGRP